MKLRYRLIPTSIYLHLKRENYRRKHKKAFFNAQKKKGNDHIKWLFT